MPSHVLNTHHPPTSEVQELQSLTIQENTPEPTEIEGAESLHNQTQQQNDVAQASEVIQDSLNAEELQPSEEEQDKGAPSMSTIFNRI